MIASQKSVTKLKIELHLFIYLIHTKKNKSYTNKILLGSSWNTLKKAVSIRSIQQSNKYIYKISCDLFYRFE